MTSWQYVSYRGVILASSLVTLVAFAARAELPDQATVEALTSGVWHAEVGEDDYLYELTFADSRFGGHLHRVSDGRHINEIPVNGLVVRDGSIQILNRGLPAYKGKVDFEAGRIDGGVPDAPGVREMNLVRTDSSEWPMLRPRPGTRSPYAWVKPPELDDGWPTADLAEAGIDRSAVETTVNAIIEDRAGAIHSLLVVRDGRLVVEEYFHGWTRADVHHAASVTKSVASLLVGIAIDRQELSGVDAQLLGFFPELRKSAGRGWKKLRLEHLLTMSLGLDWPKSAASGWPPLEDQWARILERNVEVPPGSRFRYVDRNMNLLSGVLLAATGVETDIFAARHLLEPLEIEDWNWELRRWQGHPDLIAGLKLRPRDLLKLGQLVLDEGVWKGKRVVSAEWIRESTRTHMATDYDPAYGYLWWRMDPAPPDFPLGKVTFAVGMGSQYVLVVPEEGMIVVTTGGNDYNSGQDAILGVIGKRLAPGVRAVR